MNEEEQKIKRRGLEQNRKVREKIKSDEKYAENLVEEILRNDKKVVINLK